MAIDFELDVSFEHHHDLINVMSVISQVWPGESVQTPQLKPRDFQSAPTELMSTMQPKDTFFKVCIRRLHEESLRLVSRRHAQANKLRHWMVLSRRPEQS